MHKIARSAVLSVSAALMMVSAGHAAEMATPAEAKAMTEKAMSTIKSVGAERAYATFADPNGGFQVKDLYVFCMNADGVMVSHAKKPELVGKNMLNFNTYGDFLFRDMVKVAKEQHMGWVNYKWPYPGTDQIKEKTTYIMADPAGFFCGVGAYK
ncbi:MAG: cache domain-containing protein [Magnetococcales bacterium]|nr:cache domain-containing protein [Magnetococcales bacterium]